MTILSNCHKSSKIRISPFKVRNSKTGGKSNKEGIKGEGEKRKEALQGEVKAEEMMKCSVVLSWSTAKACASLCISIEHARPLLAHNYYSGAQDSAEGVSYSCGRDINIYVG